MVTGNGSLVPICSLPNRSLLPSLTVQPRISKVPWTSRSQFSKSLPPNIGHNWLTWNKNRECIQKLEYNFLNICAKVSIHFLSYLLGRRIFCSHYSKNKLNQQCSSIRYKKSIVNWEMDVFFAHILWENPITYLGIFFIKSSQDICKFSEWSKVWALLKLVTSFHSENVLLGNHTHTLD